MSALSIPRSFERAKFAQLPTDILTVYFDTFIFNIISCKFVNEILFWHKQFYKSFMPDIFSPFKEHNYFSSSFCSVKNVHK